jgi:uncharacterized protein (TIGR04255 family)
MTSTRQLRNPPIREAIILVSYRDRIEIEKLDVFCGHSFISQKYPRKDAINILNFEAGPVPSASHKVDGFVLNCLDGCNTSIQIKLGQLSFHNTNQYVGWDNFYQEFRNIWGIFCETIGKMDLINISVRYINQLVFDLPLQNGFEEYLKLLPNIPDGVSRLINNFFIQLNVPNQDNTLTGIITETYNIAILPKNKLQVVLDISVIKAQTLVCNSDEMWSSFNSIREFKNSLFFSCLTDKTLSIYE